MDSARQKGFKKSTCWDTLLTKDSKIAPMVEQALGKLFLQGGVQIPVREFFSVIEKNNCLG